MSGDRLAIVKGTSSGIGLKLARVLDLTIIGTSRTPDKLERCRELGMSHSVLTSDDDWPEQVGAPVNVIIGTMGAGVLDANLNLLARFTEEVLPHFEPGLLRPIVDRVRPVADAARAYELLASNTTFGKVAMAMDEQG